MGLKRITGILMVKSPCRRRASAHLLCVLVCFAPALLSAQRPFPPGLPCGWEAVWNDAQSVYSYRNVFTDEQTSREPSPLSSLSNACPSASPLGAYGTVVTVQLRVQTRLKHMQFQETQIEVGSPRLTFRRRKSNHEIWATVREDITHRR